MHAIPQLWKIRRKRKESNDKLRLKLADGRAAAAPTSMMLQAKSPSSSSSSSAIMKMNNAAGAKSNATKKKQQQMQKSSSISGNLCRNNDKLQRRVVSVVDAGCTCRATVTTSTSSCQNSIQMRQKRPTSTAAPQLKSDSSSYDMIGGIVCKSTEGNGRGVLVASSGKISASTPPPRRLSIQPAESLKLQWRPPRNEAGLEVDAAGEEARGLHDSLSTTGKISEESSCSLSSSVNRNSNSITSGIGIVGDGSSSSAAAAEMEEPMLMQKDTESAVAAASMAAASHGCRLNGDGASAATPPLPSLPELLREYVATKTKYSPAAAPESHNLACFRGFEFSAAGRRRTDFDREEQGSIRHSFSIEHRRPQELETVPDERSLPLATSDRRMSANTGRTQMRRGRSSSTSASSSNIDEQSDDDVEASGGAYEMNVDFVGQKCAGRRSVDAVPPPPPTLSIRRWSRHREDTELSKLSPTLEATERTAHECRFDDASCSDYGDDEASSSSVGNGDDDEEVEGVAEGGRGGGGAVAIVKSSVDPVHDFKQSMAEMVAAEQLRGEEQLQELLQCYLCLNSRRYHGAIVRAFRELCSGAGAGAVEPPR